MSDFLTRRGRTWHFVRRVPAEFAQVDRRVIIQHSTRIKIVDDRLGRRAARVAMMLNQELELYWKGLIEDHKNADLHRYNDARRRARSLGYEYFPSSDLLLFPQEKRLERLEALVAKGLANDPTARQALLGTAPPNGVKLSQLFDEYQEITEHEVKDLSPDQLRIWRSGRERAVNRFITLVGDKPLAELTHNDAIDYSEWWRGRVVKDGVAAKTANKDIGQLSRMLKEMSVRRRLNLPDIFKGLHLRGETDKSRLPYDVAFIQNCFLGGGLRELNEYARCVLYVMIETGLRPSEIVNLQDHTILLDAPVPHVRIVADGRRLKTEQSERDIPLIGVALKALQAHPNGFPRYRDKSNSLSATINKFLAEHGLRPSKDHTLYSLRHSFKDRLVATEAPDSLIDSLMGHRTNKPKYGKGPPLELKLKYLTQIALKTPTQL